MSISILRNLETLGKTGISPSFAGGFSDNMYSFMKGNTKRQPCRAAAGSFSGNIFSLPLRTIFAFGSTLDVAHAFLAGLLEAGKHILERHFRGILPLFRLPDVGFAAAGRTGLLSVTVSAERLAAAFSAGSVVRVTASAAVLFVFFRLLHGKTDLPLWIGAN